jgi:hypothetical protein
VAHGDALAAGDHLPRVVVRLRLAAAVEGEDHADGFGHPPVIRETIVDPSGTEYQATDCAVRGNQSS